jgi:molecular chaperone GrpE (heat shock protein)
LQQTTTDVLTSCQNEKEEIKSVVAMERQKMITNQQSLLTEVDTQYKDLKDKLSANLAADLLSYKKLYHADFDDLRKKVTQQATTIQNQLTQTTIPNQIDVTGQLDCAKSTSSTKSKEPEGDHISTRTPTKSTPDESSQSSQKSQTTTSRITQGGIRPRKYPHPKDRELDDTELTALSH